MSKQQTLEGELLLDCRIRQSTEIIENILKKTTNPLIVNFSGGKDSLVLLNLAHKVTDNLVPFFMRTDIDFPEIVPFVQKACEQSGLAKELMFSSPSDYKGGFFKRLKRIGYFPTVQSNTLWCNRDLKVRPQHKVLSRRFGKSTTFFKLNGVRKAESSRRKKIHSNNAFVQKDYQVGHSFMVFPLLNWTNEDILAYIQKNKLQVTTKSLYQKFGVSGCYWCPFYQPSIYRRILKEYPNLYDKFIEWEEKLSLPSVSNFIYLRDLKREVMSIVKSGIL